MLIYSEKFQDSDYVFCNANSVISRLNKAINTSYIPTGNSIEEVITNFTKLQVSRRFSEGHSRVDRQLIYKDLNLLISYTSTSGTTVEIVYEMDSANEEIHSVEIEVFLPEERIGGCHYNALMYELYQYEWYALDRESTEIIISVPDKLQKLNPDFEYPIPNYVLDIQSNHNFTKLDPTTVFDEYGYSLLPNSVGYEYVWENLNAEAKYLVLASGYWNENRFNFLYKMKDAPNRQYSISYCRVLELLEEDRIKPKRTARSFDYEEDYNYDESNYEELDDNYTDSLIPEDEEE